MWVIVSSATDTFSAITHIDTMAVDNARIRLGAASTSKRVIAPRTALSLVP